VKSPDPVPVLLIRAATRPCALPLANVVETMRPLPITPVAGAPSVVRGVAIVRGQPVPVIDLNLLLDSNQRCLDGRFVVLRVDERRVAVVVEAVLGIAALDASQLTQVSPLLQAADAELVAAMGVRDRELFVLLEASRIVSEELWQQLQIGNPT